MKGISRRARVCAAVAVTGVAVLAGSGVAQAQSEGRQRTGDGIPTGQMGTQMFNYGGYISNGGNAATTSAITGVSAGCQTRNTPSQAVCARERLEGLFRMFQRRGMTNIELFGHTGFPATTVNTTLSQAAAAGATAVRLASTANYLAGDTLTGRHRHQPGVGDDRVDHRRPRRRPPEPNVTLTAPLTKAHAAGVARQLLQQARPRRVPRAAGQVRHPRRRPARLRERERLGGHGRRRQDPRRRLPRLGRHALPGHRQLRATCIATAETANRLGKYAVENGVGRVYIHNHQQEFRTRYVDNGVLKTAWQIYMERIDARYAAAEIDAFWASDAYDDVTGTEVAALINQFPTKVQAAAHQGRRQHRADAERHGLEHPVEPARLRHSPVSRAARTPARARTASRWPRTARPTTG